MNRCLTMFCALIGFGISIWADPANVKVVAETAGLVAFWDFNHGDGDVWTSYHDGKTVDRSFSVHLRRIGDPKAYTATSWPYDDVDSKLSFDDSGPFGRAVRFNQGYIYGAVERQAFETTPLNLHGRQPFTLIAWVKFTGKRHMVAGIWDEGGWDRYAGRRQVALFGGLFGQKGVIAHVSATGAASFPQSTINGSQYARLRAIDGKPFQDNVWIAMATTYDPENGEVYAYLNGVMTPLILDDAVAVDIYPDRRKQAANPFGFRHAIYSPQAFVLKYNGYSVKTDGVNEHRLFVDLEHHQLTYEREAPAGNPAGEFRVTLDIHRQGKSILAAAVVMPAVPGAKAAIPADVVTQPGDEIQAALAMQKDGQWLPVGKTVTRTLQEGAPFTFGRALGLGSEELKHGSQIYLAGTAVFNRILSADELRKLSFVGN